MSLVLPASLRDAARRTGRAVRRIRRVGRRRLIAGAGVVALLLVGTAVVLVPDRAAHRTEDLRITVRTGPDDSATVDLDATLYLPAGASAGRKVPAVLLAHGFGGSKQSVAADAADLADAGYAVLAWTAQGFGASTGEVHLNSPDWEVKDAQRLIDWLAARPEIATQAPGDPRVAVVGGSYGGGLALLAAAADQRIDAVVPMITWNDLARSFFPESTGGQPLDGVFKRQWAGLFFGTGGGAQPSAVIAAGARPANDGGGDPQCGRFAREVCQAYLRIATTGRADAEAVALLRRSSPASVVDRITAPTLLVQGTADSLFPLAEADANARGIAANGTPVRVAWYVGGHDGGEGPQSDVDRLHALTLSWLDHYVAGRGSAPGDEFTYSRITGLNAMDRGVITSAYRVRDYPGTGAAGGAVTAQVAGVPQRIANPPSGTPGALTSLPGTGGLSGLASFVGGVVSEIPGQHADFYSAPLDTAVDVVGAPTVRIRAASPTGEAVLFVKLYDMDGQGSFTLPDGLAAPVRLTGLPTDIGSAQPVTVTLPTIVHRFEAGHRLRVTVASSDQAYATPTDPVVYTVAAEPQVTLPTVAAVPISPADTVWWYVLAGLVAAIAVGLVVAVAVGRARGRRVGRVADPAHAETPLVVQGLRKAYDGFVAVETVDFEVRRNTVVGLLGPNGAGKTTTLRVLAGLTTPTAGAALVFGQHLVPGAPVLARVGALVEGPGFLPHLSGLANLRLYWQATGRPAEQARLDEALEIAGLGTAVHRRVKTYSHGMRQRLAIAQAMLGLPELLILDEPTDGLDPPQIAEMRRVLHRYAADGRAVLVSSHLLAEVEQTCTDVVVMHKGRVVAAGGVEDIVGDSPTVAFDVSDAVVAGKVLDGLDSVRSVARGDNGTLVVDLAGAPRAEVVAALVNAGVGVEKVVPRRRLEDAFLALVGGDTKASGER